MIFVIDEHFNRLISYQLFASYIIVLYYANGCVFVQVRIFVNTIKEIKHIRDLFLLLYIYP